MTKSYKNNFSFPDKGPDLARGEGLESSSSDDDDDDDEEEEDNEEEGNVHVIQYKRTIDR